MMSKKAQHLRKVKEGDLQVPWEVNVESVLDSKVVREQLQRNDVQDTLQAIDRLRHPDGLHTRRDRLIVLMADNNRLRLPCRDLRKRRLDLGVQRILSHDDDHRHVFVDEREGTVLQLAGEDTLGVHVRNFLDLESTLQACSVSED